MGLCNEKVKQTNPKMRPSMNDIHGLVTDQTVEENKINKIIGAAVAAAKLET